MKVIRLVSLIALWVLFDVVGATSIPEPPDGGCWATTLSEPTEYFIRCVKLGIDGRLFEQVIGEDGLIAFYTSEAGNISLKNVSLNEIADSVKLLELANSRNVTLGENALTNFVNLTELKILGSTFGERGRLNLAPGAFRPTLKVEKMEISRMEMSDESITALLELKERLLSIRITDVSPEDQMFASVAQFTNLKYMGFFNCAIRLFPASIVEGSTSTLETFEIQNCNFPKLTNDMFATSPKLHRVFLKEANLTDVDAGAFDNNPDLLVVNFRHNDLPSLPDGLFRKLKKLWEVTLEGNPRLIGSIDQSNFTHVENFPSFRLNF